MKWEFSHKPIFPWTFTCPSNFEFIILSTWELYIISTVYKSREKSVSCTVTLTCATASRQEIWGRDELLLTNFAFMNRAGLLVGSSESRSWTCPYIRASLLDWTGPYSCCTHVARFVWLRPLASNPWLLAPVFVACTTNAKSWKPEMK